MSISLDPIRGLLDGLRPIKVLSVSDWADENRVLSSESAAEPGRWRTSRTPYLRQIFEDLSPNSPIQKVIVSKGAQLGYTESGLNAVGCYMDIAPCPIMYVMPTIMLAEAVSKDRIDPMIANCDSLLRKVPSKRDRDGGNTILLKPFPGGRLILTGAESAASLRSRAIRVLILDEVDAYPLDVEGEGSPVALAEARTRTFGDRRKVYMLSTPSVEGESVIQKEVEATEINKYFVPCPFCGTMQHLKFGQLQWEEAKPETVVYQCEHCQEGIEERHKPRILAAGEWLPTVPENQQKFVRGYHINSLYSPLGWLSWKEIAEQWEEAKKDGSKLKTFVNTVLGETFKEAGEAPDWKRLYERRESYKVGSVSADVSFLTAGVDIQRDRIELEIVGWCEGKRSYSVDYRVLNGDTSKKDVWNDLSDVVSERWTRGDGALMPLKLMAIDTGYNTNEVYAFCRRFDASRVIAVKGVDRQDRAIGSPRMVSVNRAGKTIKSDVKVWNIGVSLLKSELYGWLRLFIGDGHSGEDGAPDLEPAGYCHFPQYDEHYFRGLTAEVRESRVDSRGYDRPEWVKRYRRNEPLDCRVYARAAAAVYGIDRFKIADWKRVFADYENSGVEREKPKKVKPADGGWLDRWRE